MAKAMKALHKKAVKHLGDDIAGYKKQRKHLKKEIGEDKKLIKDFTKTGSKRGKR